MGGRPRRNALQPRPVIPAYTSAWIEFRGDTGTTDFLLSFLDSAPSAVNPRTPSPVVGESLPRTRYGGWGEGNAPAAEETRALPTAEMQQNATPCNKKRTFT